MKKLFGGSKPKQSKPPLIDDNNPNLVSTPIHQQHAVYQHPQQQDRWEVVQPHSPSMNSSFASLPPGASPPIPSPGPGGPPNARSPSPFSVHSTRDQQMQMQNPPQPQRKKPVAAPVALRILGALDPPSAPAPAGGGKAGSEERFGMGSYSESGHGHGPAEKKEKRGFWSRGGDKEKEREKEREKEKEKEKDRGRSNDPRDRRADNESGELTRMIGYLTATASEDWGLVLAVTDRVSLSESNAKEAARALRREFKYGEPPAQLAAARLWAILLRNIKGDLFLQQSTSRKFLETLEDLLTSARTSPVVRERVMEILGAAAFASGKVGFRPLWKKVKPADKPEEGVPLNDDDSMFIPPVSSKAFDSNGFNINANSLHPNGNGNIPTPAPTPITATEFPPASTPVIAAPRKHKSGTESRNRIIPPEEDIRRLFQECKIGQGNASLLSQALALSRPEELERGDVIKEFYLKCRSSQELIFAQIPWASAEAERSIMNNKRNGNGDQVETVQEKLLASLLSANGELQDALQQYDDLERVAMERRAEEVSRIEVRGGGRNHQYQDGEYLGDSSDPHHSRSVPSSAVSHSNHSRSHSRSSSRSPSPMLTPTPASTQYLHSQHAPSQFTHHTTQSNHSHHHSHSDMGTGMGMGIGGLAPPPPAPHGPRSPAAPAQNNNGSNYTVNQTYGPGAGAGGAWGGGYSRTPSPEPGYVYGHERDRDRDREGGMREVREGMAGLRMRGGDGFGGQIPGVVRSSGYEYEYDYGNVHGHGGGYGEGEYGDEDEEIPVKPSAKALGKQRVVDDEAPEHYPEDDFYDGRDETYSADDRVVDSDDDKSLVDGHGGAGGGKHKQHFVYDAARERTLARIREGTDLLVNGVH